MKKGDFVEIDFVGRIASTGEVFDLTSEEAAKEEGVFTEKQKYKPSLVIVGSGMAVPGVEKKLEHMEAGEEKEFDLAPEEGFGQRNMRLIRIIPISKFTKEKINPAPGIFIDIDGMQAKILSIAGGRVRVDFNHPLAGKHLKYKVKIIMQITDTLEKTQALLSYYGIKCEARLDGENMVLESEKPMNEFIKRIAGDAIMKWVPEIKHVAFGEKQAHSPKEKEGGTASGHESHIPAGKERKKEEAPEEKTA